MLVSCRKPFSEYPKAKLMELDHLRTFITVAELGSMSATAKHLNLSVSSVSAHIKQLETEWKTELFIRTNQGVELTEKGQYAIFSAQRTIEQADALMNQMRDLNPNAQKVLRIAYSVPAHVYSISNFIESLKPMLSDFDIQLTHTDSATVLSLLQDNQLEGGFIYGSSHDRGISTRHLKTVDLVIAVPRKWAEGGDFSMLKYPWIYNGEDCPFNEIMEQTFPLIANRLQKYITSNDDRTRRELVIAGLGISLLEKTEAQHPDIVIMDEDWYTIPCPVSFVYQHVIVPYPLVTALLPHLRSGLPELNHARGN